MRARTILASFGLLLAGAIAGTMLAPPAADAVSREIIEIQQSVNQILQNQQDLRADVDTKFASMQTLVQQSVNSAGHLNQTVGALEKTIQDAQANSGANNSTVAQQVQGVSDNMQDLQARVAKLAQQMSDMQNILQQINAKVSTPPPAPVNPTPDATQGGAPGATPDTTAAQPAANGPTSLRPISGNTLYSNGISDLNSGHYDLSRQEFRDYLENFPDGSYAANAQFYLGEIAYAQGEYSSAIDDYDRVIVHYPKSNKVAPAMLEKGRALVQTHKNASAEREFRELIRRFPGSAEAKKAATEMRALGPSR
ncbi:MAG TPA: tol-pal system protein YbgF [Candidatus Acidoferrales bacterium]|nr:tol-pal system protein YbgF [Candidatus Acidoferrales bacterium]